MGNKDLLKKIDEQQVKINAFGKLDNVILKKINYKFRLDWNYYSNRMEGGTLTKQETRSVMVGNISVDGKPIKDVMEMTGHDKVVLELLNNIGKGDNRLSERRIIEVHKSIMHEDDLKLKKQIGDWKKEPNEIINYKGEKISFTPPELVKEEIHKLLNKTNTELDSFFNNSSNAKHPLILASDFHINYVTIHPFYDGNGRTARIFTNLLLIACGFPVIIIKEEHKKKYYQYLADIQVYAGNSELFYQFIAERILESQQIILDAIEGKDIEEPDDIDKRILLLKKKLQNDDKIKDVRAIETVQFILKEVVFPLFKDIELKCKELNEFFINNNRIIDFRILHSNNLIELANKKTTWEEITKWLESTYAQQTLRLTNITFEYILSGFKKSLDGHNYTIRIEFKFDQYHYKIFVNNQDLNDSFKKAYGDKLSIAEKTDVINKTMSSLLDSIERYAQGN